MNPSSGFVSACANSTVSVKNADHCVESQDRLTERLVLEHQTALICIADWGDCTTLVWFSVSGMLS